MEQSVPWDGRLHFNLSRNRQSCPFRPWWGAGPASLCPGYPGQEDGLRELEAGSSDRWLCRGESLASVICVVRRAMVTFQSLQHVLLGVSGLRTVLLLTGGGKGWERLRSTAIVNSWLCGCKEVGLAGFRGSSCTCSPTEHARGAAPMAPPRRHIHPPSRWEATR